MGSSKRIVGLLLTAVIFTLVSSEAEAASFIVRDGKANAEIVISENPTRTQQYSPSEYKQNSSS